MNITRILLLRAFLLITLLILFVCLTYGTEGRPSVVHIVCNVAWNDFISQINFLPDDVEIEQIPQISNRRTVRRNVWIARLIFRIWRAHADAARVRALAAYKDFLALWKDADPDIPILRQANAEYTKLR